MTGWMTSNKTANSLMGSNYTLVPHVNETAAEYYAIKKANLSEYQRTLIKNYTEQGKRCMIDFWHEPDRTGTHCNATWDKFQCWPTTVADTVVTRNCPANPKVNFTGAVSYRTCNESGYWWPKDTTNYSECVDVVKKHLGTGYVDYIDYGELPGPIQDPEEERTANILRDVYFFGGIISCVLLLITFFIFSYFKSLQCNRISIHKHLVVSFIIRSVLLVVMFGPSVTKRKYSYNDLAWLCKTVMALVYYSTISNIFWMFVEGLFLHNRVAVSVFNTEAPFRVFYVVGWGLPAVIILIWAICMSIFSNDRCWYNSFELQYVRLIILIPVATALAVNTIFLINIIRILITKLRANNTVETDQIRKAVKATAILFPLLGMTNLLYWIRPSPEEYHVSVLAYRVSNAVLQSSQGIFVSFIYCFMNAEVRAAILKRWQRHKARRMGDNRGRRRSSRTSSFFLSTTEVAHSHHTFCAVYSHLTPPHGTRPVGA